MTASVQHSATHPREWQKCHASTWQSCLGEPPADLPEHNPNQTHQDQQNDTRKKERTKTNERKKKNAKAVLLKDNCHKSPNLFHQRMLVALKLCGTSRRHPNPADGEDCAAVVGSTARMSGTAMVLRQLEVWLEDEATATSHANALLPQPAW